jgi:glycosyltransferase involved in cell wall biosynthesis
MRATSFRTIALSHWMKVLHVIPSLDPATGGPPMIAASLAAAQAALGCRTQIVSYQFPEADGRIASALAAIPHIADVQLEYLPPLTRPERFLARGARRRINPIVKEFDLIHLHGVWDPLIYAAASVTTAQGRPFVLTLHGMLHPWALKQRAWKKRVALAFGYRRMLNRARFLHLGNSEERRLTADLHLTPPTRIIPNGVFLEEFDPLPDRGAFRAAHPEFSDARLILFLGRLHYMKGLDFLADAFAIVGRSMPDAHLVVVGPDAGARASFEGQIARLGIADRVHMLGPLYASQKIAALRDCDCFCLPSRREGFSMAVTEALACEAPVVISTDCHFPEVRDAGAGIITDLNAPAIAAAIEAILRDPQMARRMGQAARALIISRFTWPTVARQMIEGYDAVMTG